MYINDSNNLSDEDKYFIVDALVRTKSVIDAKDEFNKNSGKTVDAPMVIKIASECKSEIVKLRGLYNNSIEDIKIASLRNRLVMLQEIHELAKEAVQVGITADGTPIEKRDLATALRAVEAADRMINQYEILKLRKFEVESEDHDAGQQSQPTLKINVVHDKDMDLDE